MPISVGCSQYEDVTVRREDTAPLDNRLLNDYADIKTTVLSGEAKDGGDLVTLVVADLSGSNGHSQSYQ